MIVARISHGLGNQLFQYAAGRELEARLGAPVRYDVRSWFEGDGRRDPSPRSYALGRLGLSVPAASDEERTAPFKRTWWGRPRVKAGWMHLRQEDAELPLTSFEEAKAPVYMEGFWQGEAFFRNARDRVAGELLALPSPQGCDPELLATLRTAGTVAIHVRRGDYVGTERRPTRYRVLGADYYRAALARLCTRTEVRRAVVFSDEPDWCCDNLRLGIPFFVAAGGESPERDGEDLYCMAQADTLIIANSTFSWWAAWMATRRGRAHVAAPAEWFVEPAFVPWSGMLAVEGWELL